VANDYAFVLDQDLFDNQAQDPLPLLNVEGAGRATQLGEECREGLRETQVDSAVIDLIEDRLQFRLQGVFALPQFRHASPQFVERQKLFLIGGQQAVDALAGPRHISLQDVLPVPCRVGRSCRRQPPIELVLDQAGILQQSDDFSPHNLVEEILTNRTIITYWAAKMAPGVGTQASVIVDLAGARPGRGTRHRIAAFPARNQALHDAGFDRPTWRKRLVLLEPLLDSHESIVRNDRGNRNFDPVGTRSFVVSAVARANAPAQPERSGDALTRCGLGFPKARRPLVGRIAQHRPNRGPLPARDLLARRNTPLIEQARDRANTHISTDVALVDHSDDSGFGIDDVISGGRVLALANITIAVRCAAENVDLTLAGAMALAAAGSFKDLCPLVFGDHALELHQQLVLRRGALRRFYEYGLDTMAGEFFDQKDLISVFAAQPIGRMHQHGLDLTFRRKIA
jgi:hypothetical protein